VVNANASSAGTLVITKSRKFIITQRFVIAKFMRKMVIKKVRIFLITNVVLLRHRNYDLRVIASYTYCDIVILKFSQVGLEIMIFMCLC